MNIHQKMTAHNTPFALRLLCIIAGCGLCGLAACDSGDIYPAPKHIEEVQVSVNAAFCFQNPDAFPENYRIVWGAFVGESPFPLAFEEAAKPAGNTWRAAPLQALPKYATHMALALATRTDNRVKFVFGQYPLAAEMNIADTIDLASFGRVQAQVFTPQCIQCHGAGERIAANLDLTEGKAYADLVGKPSQADNSPKPRVTKNNLESSFLFDVLTTAPPSVTTNHTTLSTLTPDDTALIRAWIMNPNPDPNE